MPAKVTLTLKGTLAPHTALAHSRHSVSGSYCSEWDDAHKSWWLVSGTDRTVDLK